MRRLMVMVSLLVLLGMACTFDVQTFTPPTEIPVSTPTTRPDVSANGQALDGPDINYNGIRFASTLRSVRVCMYLRMCSRLKGRLHITSVLPWLRRSIAKPGA